MSDKPPFEFVPLDIPPPKKQPTFEFTPLFSAQPPEKKAKAKISKSPNNYIAYASNKPGIVGMSTQVEGVDVVHMERAAAYCDSSGDSKLSGDLLHGQDSATILVVDDTYILVDADGVGQSYFGNLASQASTSAVAKEPSDDLAINLLTAEKACRQLSLPPPNTGTPLLYDALRRTLNESGSQTTFNQLSVNSVTGQTDGLIAGDGGATVIRTDGHRNHYFFPVSNTGTFDSRLSTKNGFMGQPRRLREIVGGDIRLSNGDTLLLYSDALQHKFGGVLIINKVCDILTSEKDPDQALAKYFAELSINDPKDDDKSLLRYTHSSVTQTA